MRVNAHTSLYAPHVGGIETMVREMKGALEDEGHSLDVLTKQWPAELSPSDVIEGVSVNRIPAGYDENSIINTAHYLHHNGESLVNEADIIHVVGMRRPLPMFSAILGAIHQKPVVSSICGLEVPNPNNQESERLWQEGHSYMPDAYHNMYQHTAVSEATRDYTTKALSMYEGKIDVMVAGIDYRHYSSLPVAQPEGVDSPYIMSLRRLEASKGIDVLIDAYAKLLHDYPDTRADLVIAGDGLERHVLEMQVDKLRLSKRVHFIGSIGLDLALGMLKGAEATVVPSTAEAGGLVNTEANAVGCPLIASNVGGIREYTTEDAALLVKPGDSGELAQALHTVLNDKTLTQRLVRNGKVFAESRDWSNVINDYVRLYETAKPIDPRRLQLTTNISKRVFSIMESGYDRI